MSSRYKSRYLYYIIPVKLKDKKSVYYGYYSKLVGFWGFIFRVFDREVNRSKIYKYYGSYFKAIFERLYKRIFINE